MDFSAALCDPAGETVAQAVTIPLHLGSIPTAMRSLLERFGGRMEPGDMFVMNDPFDGGMHTPDIYVVKPVFAAAWAHRLRRHRRAPRRRRRPAARHERVRQHRHLPGGAPPPWVHLYRGGEPVDDLVRIIRANVRIPRMTMGDLNAQIAACNIAERALQELADALRPRAADTADERGGRPHREDRQAARSPAGRTAPRPSSTTSTPTASTSSTSRSRWSSRSTATR